MLRSFQRGAPGLALLVLRNALAVMLISFASKSQLISSLEITAILVAVPVLCLCVGLFTTSVAAFCGVGALACLPFARHGLLEYAAIASAVSFCVAALGPGAYSVDSLWFGRWKRVFPPE